MIFSPYQHTKSGQSLIELILAIALGVVFIGVAALVIAPILKINTETNEAKVGGALGRELMENARLLVENNWHSLDGLIRGAPNYYYLSTSTDIFALNSGVESINIGTTTYNRYFYVENICRDDADGSIKGVEPCIPFDVADPSLAKISIDYAWSPEYATKTFSAIVSRFRNKVTTQTDWSLGPGVNGTTSATTGFVTSFNIYTTSTPGSLKLSDILGQGTAIIYNVTSTPGEHWAWYDTIGWIDFKISSQELKGSASSSWGPIYLNCATTPNGCGSSNFKVANDSAGRLSGYAWNDVFGWLGFNEVGTGYTARVLIKSRALDDTPPSDFEQWAWNPVIGWVSFNCRDLNTAFGISPPADYCIDTSNYKVTTDWYSSSTQGWVESAIFDTGVEGGVHFNSILWRGELLVGTMVRFQFAASSNPDGPWTFAGPGGSASTYYEPTTTSQDINQDLTNVLYSAPIDYDLYNNTRYFRYRMILFSDSFQTLSPTVKDVVVNWSP